MPLRNRVDPWGDLHAVSARGTFTGNRGCLVNDDGEVVRHHQGDAWITCRLEYKDWKHPLDLPRTWTPLFFLDEAVALAAGHRPCAFCRREDYNAYCRAIAEAEGLAKPLRAREIDQRLSAERLVPGRGLSRAKDRKTWTAENGVPPGTVVVDSERHALLVKGREFLSFGFDGWRVATERPPMDLQRVLTPPTSVAALAGGYRSAIT
ncbi:MAG: hypothetical protein ACRDWA_13015 [Acidimicrobiia bacterium]